MSQPELERKLAAAQKTVVVLKNKVREMYGGGAQTALHRALDKAKGREEKNRQRREMAEMRATELRKYSEHLEGEVARRTKAIQTILDNVTFGFLVIDRELTVREGFTRSCSSLFGQTPQVGQDVGALLDIVGKDLHGELMLSVDQVFEDLLPEDVTLDQMADRFEVKGRVLHLDARAVRDDDGAVEGLLLTVSDITALEKAQHESKVREVLIGILQQKHAFEQFVADTRAGFVAARDNLDDEKLVRRVVHTVKGNAASWGLTDVVQCAHHIETGDVIDSASIDELEKELVAFMERHRKVLDLDYERVDRAYAVPSSDIRRLRELAAASDSGEVRRWVAEVIQRPARELLGPLPSFVEKLAERLDKKVVFELQGADLLVDADAMRPVLQNLPHLIRNAIDHGIEPSWERGDKPAHGSLTVTITDHEAAWEIAVQDDGRGVPVQTVVSRAVTLGHVQQGDLEKLSEQQRLELVFVDGVSSADRTTDISGRGVGMSAVRASGRAQGGTVHLLSDKNGTRVVLKIPKASDLAVSA